MPGSVNPLVLDTATPAILETRAWLAAYDGAAGPAIDLSQAAPAYPPPDALLDRLAAAAGAGDTARYGPVPGDDGLREAYARHAGDLYGGRIARDEVTITAGCNQAFFIAMMVMARAGDAVILPAPWYFNHKMTLDMLGIAALALPCRPEGGFVPDVGEAERLVDDRTRAIVLVSPNNPTGAVYGRDTIEAFRRLCAARGLWLVLDETYRDFLPAGAGRPHDAFAREDWRDTVVGLYSFSKAYAVPGHRLGAITAAARLGPQIVKVQDCVQIGAARAGQAALAWGIGALGAWREENRAAINRRAAAFRSTMGAVTGWSIDAIGAHFAYLRHPFAAQPAEAVAERLARERGVLFIPGAYFGPGQASHLRVAFANLDDAALAALPERLTGLGRDAVPAG